MDSGLIKDYVMLAIMVMVFGVPALAIAARLAIKPVVDAIVRLKQIAPAQPNYISEARVEALEAEVARLNTELQRLSEAESFTRQLNRPSE